MSHSFVFNLLLNAFQPKQSECSEFEFRTSEQRRSRRLAAAHVFTHARGGWPRTMRRLCLSCHLSHSATRHVTFSETCCVALSRSTFLGNSLPASYRTMTSVHNLCCMSARCIALSLFLQRDPLLCHVYRCRGCMEASCEIGSALLRQCVYWYMDLLNFNFPENVMLDLNLSTFFVN